MLFLLFCTLSNKSQFRIYHLFFLSTTFHKQIQQVVGSIWSLEGWYWELNKWFKIPLRQVVSIW